MVKLRFLITAGGTREYIDPVRFISNASSGKMGYALVQAAIRAGHDVTLISAPANLRPPQKAKLIKVETAAQMFTAVKKYFKRCDCLLMAAAVSDYTPAKPAKTKIKKSGLPLTLRLKPTADILAWTGKNKKQTQLVAGFALEDKDLKKNAQRKLADKKIDIIIANTPPAIGADKSTLHIKTVNSGWVVFENISKTVSAGKIIRLLEELFGEKKCPR